MINDCVALEDAVIASKKGKFASVWWLKDTISRHLRQKGHRNHRAIALEDHERLKFAACTLLWWLLLGDLSDDLGGRPLKGGKRKNHLEDKVYPHELANACVEFEETHKVPLSLVNEAIFEASFIFRDELIEAFRSKVAIERGGRLASSTK